MSVFAVVGLPTQKKIAIPKHWKTLGIYLQQSARGAAGSIRNAEK